MEIVPLHRIPDRLLPVVGGKAKGLYRLADLGLNIGRGFVLADVKSEEDVIKAAAYYEQSGLGKVAVRSSANNEDGAEFSSAGQYKTFLNVEGREAFVQAVRGCVESLKGREAESYGKNFTGALSSVMSVVVQGMVEAVKAGVCFSVNPIGSRDDILLEAVEGLGESLVSGEADSIQYLIDRKRALAGDLCPSEIDESASLLTVTEIEQIVTGALLAERRLDMPVDTEWAIGKDGVLVWLQARAITTLEETDIGEFDSAADISDDVMTTCNIGEMLPGAASPLAITSTLRAVDYAMRFMLEASGAYKKGKNRELKPGSCIMSFYNTQFLNMSVVYKMAYSVLGASKGAIEMSLCGRHLDFPMAEKRLNKLRKFRNMFAYFSFLFGTKKARRRIDRHIAELEAPDSPANRAADGLAEQYDLICALLPALDYAFAQHFVMSAHSGAMSSALYQIVDAKVQDFEKTKAAVAPLLNDIDGIESVDILRSMRAVVREALRDRPEIKLYDSEKLTAYFRGAQGAVREKLDAFLARHGHRAIREIEVRSKSWHNDEQGLIENLKTVISTGGEEPSKANRAAETIQAFLTPYKGAIKGGLKFLIKQSRQGVVNREYTKSKAIKVADYIKTGYIRLAQGMVRQGMLPDEDLIYFLTHEEIKEVLDGNSALIKRAVARRRIFPQQEAMEFDDVFLGRPKPITHSDAEYGADTIKGTPISRGLITGRARVVKSFEDAAKLERGEIMVAAFTDIGWSPFYCLVGGLITERGSALSHGAVVAREYALPLVSSVTNATQLIKTGDVLKLDANSGLISILT
ncbi:MAG: hypothetical protein LBH24_04065 [Clostridiales bacterium]|jgi:pyruvate,water dikinase|nr:hypothetical protein [Clostridiales bacterium]